MSVCPLLAFDQAQVYQPVAASASGAFNQRHSSSAKAVTIMLEHQAPYPAVVLNQHWYLQMANRPKLAGLINHLLSLDPPEHWQTPTPQSWEGPMLTANLNVHGQPLSIFSTLTSFGTALDAGLQELMIESYFPADDATKAFFENLDGADDN